MEKLFYYHYITSCGQIGKIYRGKLSKATGGRTGTDSDGKWYKINQSNKRQKAM